MKTKVVPICESYDQKADDLFPNKINTDQLRKIWNDEQYNYTDEELTRIREWLYVVASIVISVSKGIEDEYKINRANNSEEYGQVTFKRKL